MKIGGRVAYIDSNGKQHGAGITGVPATGASGKKILNLEYKDAEQRAHTVDGVVHRDDREAGKGFWLLPAEAEEPADRRAPIDQQPIALAKAEESLGLPGADRRVSSEVEATSPKRVKKARNATT